MIFYLPMGLGFLVLSVIKIREWYFPKDNLVVPIWKQHFSIVAYLATNVIFYFMFILCVIFRYLGVSDTLMTYLILATLFCNTLYLAVLYASKRKEVQNSSPEFKTVLRQIRIVVIMLLLSGLFVFWLAIYLNIL
jgi:Ca2+/Na+ antiporter